MYNIFSRFFIMYRLSGGGKTIQWAVFRHNGPFFPDEYTRHNLPVQLSNRQLEVSSIGEEYLTLYANYLDTDYVKNSRFNKNFLKDIKNLAPEIPKSVSSMDEFDLTEIKAHLDKIKERKKNMSKEQKTRIKENNDKIEEPSTPCNPPV